MGNETKGMLIGTVGVLIFSLTLPFTRIAVLELSPLFVAFGRALLAGVCAVGWLYFSKARLPTKTQLWKLFVIAMGIVYGFPIFTSIAMTTLPSAHGGIVLGVLPLVTAIFGAIRFREKPSVSYWLAAIAGSLLVLCYAYLDGANGLMLGDLWLLLAIIFAALGYAEGGKLSAEMGAVNVISWALALTLPINILATYVFFDVPLNSVSNEALGSFLYVALFSMYIGFFFWYRGLAIGGVARVGQVQLLQPFATLVGANIILGELFTLVNAAFAVAVFLVVVIGRRMPIYRH